MPGFRVEETGARAWTDEQLGALFAESFPPFITADHGVKPYITRVRELFSPLDIILVDDDDQPVATGWGVPIAWSGDVAELPESFADILRRAVELHDDQGSPDTLVICGGVVHPQRKGTGLATELVVAMRDNATAQGLAKVVAPVRPTRKHLYPLFDIREYAAWVRDDGLPWDPWLRLHIRIGGRVVALAPRAQTMTGTVAEWEAWTGLELPATGSYVIPDGLSPLQVDRKENRGTYVEPNVWVRHR